MAWWKQHEVRIFVASALVGVLGFVALAGLAWFVGPGVEGWGIEQQAQLGDSFGIANAVVSLAAFAALLYTLTMQRQELAEQRRALELQRQELEESREVMKQQEAALRAQEEQQRHANVLAERRIREQRRSNRLTEADLIVRHAELQVRIASVPNEVYQQALRQRYASLEGELADFLKQ